MPALDYGVISSAGLLPQTDDSSSRSVQNAPPVQQFDLPPVEVPQDQGALSFEDLPPAMGAVGSHPGRGEHTIKNIILHSSDGREQGDLNTLTQSPNAGAHFYVTRTGNIYPLVNLDDTAYHAGKVSNDDYSNESTIGIEQEHYDPGGPGGKEGEDWPDAQVNATARLVAALQNKYGLNDSNVLYHSQIAFPAGRKQDPYNYPRDKFNQFVAAAKGEGAQPTQVAAAAAPQAPTVLYPWQFANQLGVTIGDVMAQQGDRETGNIVFNTPAPTASLQVRATHYAYPGEQNTDPYSAKGLGVENRRLSSGQAQSVGFSPDVEQSFQANLGDQFVVTRPDGTEQNVTFDDRTDPSLRGRVDFYDPSGKIGDQGVVSIRQAGQPQQQTLGAAAPQVTYPGGFASSSPEIDQAIKQAIARNQFASTETGVPAGYTPPDQQKVGLVLSGGDPKAQTRPENFGLRVATDADVEAFKQAQAKGLDVNSLDPNDKLALLLKMQPGYLTRPENKGILDEMVLEPQKAASAGQSLSEKIFNAIGTGVQGLIGSAQDIGTYIRKELSDTIPATRALVEKAMGQTPDPDALTGLADITSMNAQGVAKTVTDLHSLLANTRMAGVNLYTGLGNLLTQDPAKRAELHDNWVNETQNLARDQQWVADAAAGVQGGLAQAYSATGLFADLAAKLKTYEPDPHAVSGFSQLAQFALPEAAGWAATAFKPLMAGRALEALEDTAVARNAKYALDSTQVVPRNVAEEAANPNYSTIRGVQANVAPDARAANAAYQAENVALQQQLTNLGKTAGDPGTATALLNQVLNKGGDAAVTMGDAASKVLSVPDRVLNFASGGNPFVKSLLEKMGKAMLFGNLAHAGHAFWGRLAEYGLDMVDDAPHIPQAASALRDLLKTMGREGTYGETSIPYWTRVSQGNKLISPHMAAFLDSKAVQTIASAVKAAPAGMATNAFIGAITDPNDPLSGAIAGSVQGGAYAMVGGGFGQYQRFSDPNQVYLKARGDWKRTVDSFGTGQRQQFLSLQPRDQLILSTYLQQAPDLRVNFFHDPTGVQGSFGRPIETPEARPPVPTREDIQKRAYEISQQRQASGQAGTATSDWMQAERELSTAAAPQAPPATGPVPPRHYFDSADNPTISINTADPESTVRAVFAHELMHGTESAGMTPDIYDALLGNPDRGTPGQYTALDAKGNPEGIDPATGRYTTTQEFQNLKNGYITNLARSGEPTSHLSDLDIAREIFAEHGVDYLLSPKGAVDATSSFRPGWINRNMLERAYAKMGFAFDRQGNFVGGTHLFDNVKPNDVIDKLVQRFWQTNFRERSIDNEEHPTRTFTREDLRSGNAADTFLDTAPEIMRNPDGSVMRDSRGVPLMRTPAQVREYNAKLTNDMMDRIAALPEDRKVDIGHQILPNGNVFVRYLPQELRDALARTNQYNPHQIKALNVLSEMLADKSKMGTNFRIFYNKALSEGKRYGSFSGTEKFAVPYGFELSRKTGQVNLRSVDFDQLNQNYLNNATRAPFRDLWKNPSEFVQDWNTYFQNHSRGDPGATGIGEAKRDAINSLLRLDTSVNRDANPLLEARGGRGFPSTRPIIKSYRIDRASQVTPMEMTSPFNDVAQYRRMNNNYLPSGRQEPYDVLSPDDQKEILFKAGFKEIRRSRSGWQALYENQRTGEQYSHQIPTEYKSYQDAMRWVVNDRAYHAALEEERIGPEPTEPGSEADWWKSGGTPDFPISYLPRKAAPVAEPSEVTPTAAPADTTAIPVTYRTTKGGKTIEQPIDYGITSAPLVTDKQPSGSLSENNFGHVDFLTKPEQQKLTALDKNSAVTTYADRLVDEFGNWKDNKDVMAGKSWYKNVRGYLKTAFGKDQELFAHLLAATSAGQNVVQNWRDAFDAYHRYQSGAFDDAIRQYKKTGEITDDMAPRKANGAKYGFNSDAVLKVLAGTWLDEVQGPKTPNFFRNLFGRGNDATIDLWAARTMRRLGYEGVEGAPQQWRITPPSETGVSDLDFAFSQQVFRQAADKLGMNPHELQAIMWYAEKHNWAEKGWAKGGMQAAKASYVPMLKAYAAEVKARGGPSFREPLQL